MIITISPSNPLEIPAIDGEIVIDIHTQQRCRVYIDIDGHSFLVPISGTYRGIYLKSSGKEDITIEPEYEIEIEYTLKVVQKHARTEILGIRHIETFIDCSEGMFYTKKSEAFFRHIDGSRQEEKIEPLKIASDAVPSYVLTPRIVDSTNDAVPSYVPTPRIVDSRHEWDERCQEEQKSRLLMETRLRCVEFESPSSSHRFYSPQTIGNIPDDQKEQEDRTRRNAPFVNAPTVWMLTDETILPRGSRPQGQGLHSKRNDPKFIDDHINVRQYERAHTGGVYSVTTGVTLRDYRGRIKIGLREAIFLAHDGGTVKVVMSNRPEHANYFDSVESACAFCRSITGYPTHHEGPVCDVIWATGN